MITPGAFSKAAIKVVVSLITSPTFISACKQPNTGVQRRAKRVRCNSLFGGGSVNSTCLATHSVEDPRPAEGFPAALRHLLVHQEHRATNLRRRATRRCDKRSGELTPPDPCSPRRARPPQRS